MTTNPSKPLDKLEAIRHSEPLAVLASLSLVITAFVFPYKDKGLGAIYNDSIVSGFMFIISFVVSIIYDYYKHLVPSQYQNPALDRILEIGVYFFLAVGIIYLLLVAIEFGKTQVQIFALVKTFFYSLMYISNPSTFITPRMIVYDGFCTAIYERRYYCYQT